MPKRNDPCHCGSGKKYKNCHMKEDRDSERPKKSAQKPNPVQPKPEPREVDPETQRLNDLYDLFNDADYEEKLAILRSAVEEQALDGELAFEFFNDLLYYTKKKEQRRTFMELAMLLKANQPDVYAQENNWFWSWEVNNALVLEEQEMLQEATDQLIKNGGEALDEFYPTFHALLYYDRREVLLNALGRYTPEPAKGKYFGGVKEELNQELCDLIILNYIETHAQDTLLEKSNFEALCTVLNEYSHDLLPDGLATFISWAGGLESGQWSVEDFRLEEQDNTESWQYEEDEGEDEPDPAILNLRHLSFEFLHYARQTEQIPLTKADMARGEIVTYVLKRQRGEIPVEGQRKRGKYVPPHILLPDFKTLDSYLTSFYGFMANRTYEGAAFFELLPTWVRFLQTRGLVTEEEGARTMSCVRSLKKSMFRILEQGSDPMLVANIDTWGEKSAG